MSHSKPAGGEITLIALGDIGPLVVDSLGLKPDPNSPIVGFVSDYEPGSGKLSRDGVKLGKRDLTRRALTVLAHPQLFFTTLMAGGLGPITQEVACHAPAVELEAFVSIAPAPDDVIAIQWHQNAWEFLARWFNGIASNASVTAPNLIPPPISGESLLYIFHAVDTYNRTIMQSRLDYVEIEGRPVIDPDTFADTLLASLSSGDSRWLLPAFLGMMPGISAADLEGSEEARGMLETIDFFRAAEDDEGNDILAFGDAAIVMGEEFARLWSGSAGFCIAVVEDGALKPLEDGFLAATALANHLVLLTSEEGNGHPLLRHLALTRDELENIMAPILADALERATKKDAEATSPQPPKPPRSDAVPPPSPTANPCPACDRSNPPDVLFCGYCGTRMPIAPTNGEEM